MRQIILNVPRENREKIFKAVDEFHGISTVTIPNGENDVFIILLPPQIINSFLIAIGKISEKA